MNSTKILSLSGISKSYAGTHALDDVSFDLFAGEVHCLVGENGAGKSTLIKILSGAETPDEGEIVLFDRRYSSFTPSESLKHGISTIYQDVDLVTSLTVADNIFLGDETRTRLGFVDVKRQVKAAQALMERLSIDIEPGSLVQELSPAKRQTLQIVKALHRDAKILIMDEPTASLGKEESVALMRLIGALVARGMGIIYISHHLDEVFEVGSRITVLKDGRKVAHYSGRESRPEQIVNDMVGRDAALFFTKDKVPIGEVVLQVQNFGRGNLVQDVSFDVREGEIFGIGGLVGSGRSELVKLLFGADRRDSGVLILHGVDVTPTSPRQAIANGICLVAEDRKEDALFMSRPVLENITVVRNEQHLFLDGERPAAQQQVDGMRISLANVMQEVSNLSGGNQQKTVIARWLLSKASVFIFDEPTKGVDIGAKAEIYRLMTNLAQQGKAIVMVSSDLPELLSMSDRIGIMRHGKMIAVVPREQETEQSLMNAFIGLSEVA